MEMVAKHRRKTTGELLDSAESINKSIDFWENQIKECLRLLDKQNSSKVTNKLIKQLKILIAKGRLEIKNIDNWEKESFYAKNKK